MQLREFYNGFLQELKPLYGFDEASAVSTIIFEHFAGKTKADIITEPHYIIEKENLSALESALLQLKRHVPVQYITGHAWFAGLPFKVTPAVLIPRPETEELLNETIDFIKANTKKTLLDIGTGSGCIPVAVKNTFPAVEVSAADISSEALLVAKENAAANNTQINWINMNFLEEKEWRRLQSYDVITSNPPYIPENEKDLLDKNVTDHEPHLALFVPTERALIFYEKIALFGREHLAPGGCIFMETHEMFAAGVAKHFTENGYQATIKKDFYGKERMVLATRSR